MPGGMIGGMGPRPGAPMGFARPPGGPMMGMRPRFMGGAPPMFRAPIL